jgi:hypothetical protein
MCKKAGIRTFVMFFTGFPTETLEEAEKTVAFIESHAPYINQVAFSNFILEHRSPVSEFPSQYGISNVFPYEGEDLKIYSRYDVPSGLSSEEAVAFLDNVKNRPAIRNLLDTFLFSRSHLIFLPQDKELPLTSLPANAPEIDFSKPEILFPKLQQGVVRYKSAYRFEEIDTFVSQKEGEGTGNCIEKNPSYYLFHSIKEKMVEIDHSGFLLLKPCNGFHRLDDILYTIGEQNRETALNFYKKLWEDFFDK